MDTRTTDILLDTHQVLVISITSSGGLRRHARGAKLKATVNWKAERVEVVDRSWLFRLIAGPYFRVSVLDDRLICEVTSAAFRNQDVTGVLYNLLKPLTEKYRLRRAKVMWTGSR